MDSHPNPKGFRSRNGLHCSAAPDLAIDDVPNPKNCRLPLMFALSSPMATVCTNGCHAQFVFNSCPRAAPTHADVVAGIQETLRLDPSLDARGQFRLGQKCSAK